MNTTTKASVTSNFGLYAILTGPLKGYEYMTKLLVDHKIAFIQLRIKDESIDAVRDMAQKMRRWTEGSSSRLIINDHPEIACEVDADGVHIGQDDLAYSEVRAMVGPEKIIGLSTHSPEQSSIACALQPDYIGVGPVYPTPTKKIADPAIGIDGMSTMITASTVPAVAIGGIDLNNLRDVLSGGAKNFCMVRQLIQSENPQKTLKEISGICREFGITIGA